jgi:hypothetical protein
MYTALKAAEIQVVFGTILLSLWQTSIVTAHHDPRLEIVRSNRRNSSAAEYPSPRCNGKPFPPQIHRIFIFNASTALRRPRRGQSGVSRITFLPIWRSGNGGGGIKSSGAGNPGAAACVEVVATDARFSI